MKYKIKVYSTDPEINRTLEFQGILIEANSEEEATQKAYKTLSVKTYKE